MKLNSAELIVTASLLTHYQSLDDDKGYFVRVRKRGGCNIFSMFSLHYPHQVTINIERNSMNRWTQKLSCSSVIENILINTRRQTMGYGQDSGKEISSLGDLLVPFRSWQIPDSNNACLSLPLKTDCLARNSEKKLSSLDCQVPNPTSL